MHPYKETTIHKLYTGREARLNFAYCTFKRHMVQKWAHTHCLAAKLGSYSMNIQTLMVMPVWHPFMKCHYLLLGLCGVLWAVCGVLWAVCGVLWAVCGVLWAVCGVLCVVCCGLCGVLHVVCCGLCAVWVCECVCVCVWCLFSFYSFFSFLVPETINSPPNISAFWHHLLHTCSITTAYVIFLQDRGISPRSKQFWAFKYIHYLLHTKFLI